MAENTTPDYDLMALTLSSLAVRDRPRAIATALRALALKEIQETALRKAAEARGRALRDQLVEVDEVLTEMGWHADRGLLQRVRETITPPSPASEPWCPFCKKAHAGGDTCMGHYP